MHLECIKDRYQEKSWSNTITTAHTDVYQLPPDPQSQRMLTVRETLLFVDIVNIHADFW